MSQLLEVIAIYIVNMLVYLRLNLQIFVTTKHNCIAFIYLIVLVFTIFLKSSPEDMVACHSRNRYMYITSSTMSIRTLWPQI